MKTILWQKPDNSIAFTTLRPGLEDEMSRAALFAYLVPEKQSLLLERDILSTRIAYEMTNIEGLHSPTDESVLNDFETKKEYHNTLIKAAVAERRVVQDKLNYITMYEQTVDEIGLTVEGHAKLLQTRGDVPHDWSVIATDVPRPWVDGWKKESHKWNGLSVEVDITAARADTKERLRAEREPLLKILDVQSIRNIEQNLPNANVTAEKQRLRDITLLVEPLNTLQDLSALTATLT